MAGLLIIPATARADDVTVGLRLVPPYVIERGDGSLSGLEFELVRDALNRAGHHLVPKLLPFGRLAEDFRRGALPAFTPASAAMALPGCLSDVSLIYQNIGLSLRERELAVTAVQQLRGLRLLAFQNARTVLTDLGKAVEGNPDYAEVANQVLQVRGLFSGRADMILGDRRIFHALITTPTTGIEQDKPVREHALFPPTLYRVAFIQPQLCADFNRGLAMLRASGEYDRLVERYDPAPLANDGRQRGELRRQLRPLRG